MMLFRLSKSESGNCCYLLPLGFFFFFLNLQMRPGNTNTPTELSYYDHIETLND